MANPMHHVIIGSGSAGFGAAMTLRQGDPECRISMMTMDSLPFYNRYDLPQVFQGRTDWRDMLAAPPAFYDENRITLRRHNRVVDVDGTAQRIRLAHQESVSFDRLLVCSGGRAYVPENLTDSLRLMHGLGSYEAVMRLHQDLPQGGHAIFIGGDMIGIDLMLMLVRTGYSVTLITTPQTLWPHEVSKKRRDEILAALAGKGVAVNSTARPVAIEDGSGHGAARVVTLEDGSEITGDVVVPACGLVASVEFMLRAGVDIERGLLVNPELGTTNDAIWAAGDVCQIWNDVEKVYQFRHGWKSVRIMGELAAGNMLGAHRDFDVNVEDQIDLDDDGDIQSTFWEH